MTLRALLEKTRRGENLAETEAQTAFDGIFEGKAPDEEIAAFLTALADKGETVEELLGAARTMRGKMIAVAAPPGAIDIVGTGGDGIGTYNISTAAALVVAACGVPVAKHGNRASTSRSGSSDLLAALGVNLGAETGVLERCLAEANICFLFANRHHPSMRRVAEIRKKLGRHTIFNLLGPLTNPANVKRHLIGVYELEALGPMAEALRRLGSEAAWLAHGQDGMDEVTTTAPTDIVALERGLVRHFEMTPEEFGIARARIDDLKGGNAAANAAALKKLLAGEHNAYRDIVLFNSAAALVVAGRAGDVHQGLRLATEAVDNGTARHTLDLLVQLTNGLSAA
ncbi:MAG TPA: anthranilate phosphoribosyltransferase [Alphaproteobacteria bacterium]|nr:anthranilate phosphoribosyltransferase [Alphaproteobacteria bacterium]